MYIAGETADCKLCLWACALLSCCIDVTCVYRRHAPCRGAGPRCQERGRGLSKQAPEDVESRPG